MFNINLPNWLDWLSSKRVVVQWEIYKGIDLLNRPMGENLRGALYWLQIAIVCQKTNFFHLTYPIGIHNGQALRFPTPKSELWDLYFNNFQGVLKYMIWGLSTYLMPNLTLWIEYNVIRIPTRNPKGSIELSNFDTNVSLHTSVQLMYWIQFS